MILIMKCSATQSCYAIEFNTHRTTERASCVELRDGSPCSAQSIGYQALAASFSAVGDSALCLSLGLAFDVRSHKFKLFSENRIKNSVQNTLQIGLVREWSAPKC